MRYTKPGITSQIYPLPPIISKANHSDIHNEQTALGRTSMKFQKAENEEGEKTHKVRSKKHIEKENISSNEINDLLGDSTVVVENLQEISRQKIAYGNTISDDPDRYSTPRNDSKLYEQFSLHEFFSMIAEYSEEFAEKSLYCAKRRPNRSSSIVTKSFTSLTSTDDQNYEGYFAMPVTNTGSWFTNEQAHDCIQLLIKADKGIYPFDTKIEENERVWGDDVSVTEADNEDDDNEHDSQWRTPEEIRNIQELDNPNRKWKRRKPITEAFMKQKIRNIIEFQQLCDNFPNS